MDSEPQISTVKVSLGDLELTAQLYEVETAVSVKHAALILHGFPSRELEAEIVTSGLDALALRIVTQMDCKAMVLGLRGCGGSDGNFSLQGWVEDATAAIQYLADEHSISHVWVVGFGTGGAVGLVSATESAHVDGVATLGSPADFDDWYANPKDLLEFARQIGAISDTKFPSSVDEWQAELAQVRAVVAAGEFSPKPLMIIHGSEDGVVPHFDARIIADEHGEADLRFIDGGGHQLKQDPRAIAVLLGWLDRVITLTGSTRSD